MTTKLAIAFSALLLGSMPVAAQQVQPPQPASQPAQRQAWTVYQSHISWQKPASDSQRCPELTDPQPGQSGWHVFLSHVQWYGDCVTTFPSFSTAQ
jgi:hypothetical protein